ncbi:MULTISPECIES: type VI secretion system tube protein Hcp [Marinomonas]|jgi:type VI secretion system secreted protein Hcp|uniref:Type VI secretion system tube protein Hcp n=2 Tax=Marinomonas TaxID=28253 RepID=A0A7H1JB89_9GAMM|nr:MULTISPECIES: type VI secretion system tube protein Hcp [Marinomonas]MCS7485461.1 hypothetical protein [Marinomonas sp. BSi20414]MCW4628453.1 type VI secretion system tube protein Hcp [Marinomonas sp. KJ51-3]QNT07755.1 type VI secretion system tube protein Hcp [Marinomonas arctica]GGN25296.1 hypothetical protein GCM10011350_14930 [Marinomonas arctica]
MDLILLQFGVPNFNGTNTDATGVGSLIDGAAGEGDGPAWSELKANAGGAQFDWTNCVELVSINQGIKQQITTDVSNNARTSGRPMITDFTCVKYVDQTSPKMYDFCLRAKTLDVVGGTPTIIWVLRNSGDQFNIIMRFELRLALISEIDFQSHPNDMPTEQFKLNFTEIGWHHQVQGANVGNQGGFSAAAWSVAKNRPIAALSS